MSATSDKIHIQLMIGNEMHPINAEKEADRAPILDIVTALTAEVEQVLASKTDIDKA